jgi:hypothetical protein
MTIIRNVTLYEVKTDEPIAFAWSDASPEITNKELEFYLYNWGEQIKYINGKTATTQISLMIPKTGLYEVYLRTCNPAVTDPNLDKCSEWISSFSLAEKADGTLSVSVIDASGNLIPGKWLIYAHVAAPTQGGIVNQ